VFNNQQDKPLIFAVDPLGDVQQAVGEQPEADHGVTDIRPSQVASLFQAVEVVGGCQQS
jgi:hypothetical protein